MGRHILNLPILALLSLFLICLLLHCRPSAASSSTSAVSATTRDIRTLLSRGDAARGDASIALLDEAHGKIQDALVLAREEAADDALLLWSMLARVRAKRIKFHKARGVEPTGRPAAARPDDVPHRSSSPRQVARRPLTFVQDRLFR